MTLTDDSKIAFGKHITKKLIDIPASYFVWLLDQKWFTDSKDSYYVALKYYINDNLQALNEEYEKEMSEE